MGDVLLEECDAQILERALPRGEQLGQRVRPPMELLSQQLVVNITATKAAPANGSSSEAASMNLGWRRPQSCKHCWERFGGKSSKAPSGGPGDAHAKPTTGVSKAAVCAQEASTTAGREA